MARLAGLVTPKRTLVVCGEKHAKAVRAALPKLPAGNVVVEPQARNTAPAIALACAHVAHLDPEAVMVVLPSDQHVANVPAFQEALEEAARVARTGAIVTLGIRPTRPETGYGYIRFGAQVDGTAVKVDSFVEKPDRPTAEGYLASGDYLWNAGIFVFTAASMLKAFDMFIPEMAAPLLAIRKALGTRREKAVLAKEFAKMPALSIDYGVAEKADNIMVVPCDCGWSDVGSFNALAEVRQLDHDGNVVVGKYAMAIDSAGSVVVGGDRPVAVIGMKDVVVVDAGDAILVVPKDRCQDVRKAVEVLKGRKLQQFL